MMSLRPFAIAAFALLCVRAAPALEPGRASGTFTLDGQAVPIAHAVSYGAEDLFDSSRTNTMVVLTDKELVDISPTDEWSLKQAGEQGHLVVLTLRLDGPKLVNVGVNHAGISGTAVLPGPWFTHQGEGGAGSLSLTPREFDGHTYAGSIEFSATSVPAHVEEPPPAAAPEEVPAPAEPEVVLPATTSSMDPQAMTAALIAAMMQKDEDQAVKLVKMGAPPNGRDPYGVPVLNWAVMMCMPRVVQALVDAKADLTYERAPGLTILTEAGACPEAARILKAAGAR